MQIINNHTVTVHKAKSTGERILKVLRPNNKAYLIPADIARLCGGKDKWLSEVVVVCRDCKTKFKLTDSDSPLYCPDCWDYAGWENTHSDDNHADNPDSDCPVCKKLGLV